MKYSSEAELRKKINVLRIDDLARDLITIRADFLLRSQISITRESLTATIIDPTDIIFDAVEHVTAQVVDQIKTKEVVQRLEALQQLRQDLYKCPRWFMHERALKKLGLV
jgi:hypothetical protein